MRARLAIALLLAACGTTPAATDAGSDAPLGALGIAIVGPDYASVGVDACFTAVRSGVDDSVPVTVTWADGTTSTIGAGETEACHAWRLPGGIVMGMSIDARGMHVDATHLVHVVFAPSDPRPTSSSPIAYDDAHDLVWVVEPDADLVTVIDATTRRAIRSIAVGDRPRTVAVSDGGAIVACQGDGTVHVLGAPMTEVHDIVSVGAGTEPYGVVRDPRGARAWVTLENSGELAAIDLGALSVGARIDVGRDPRSIALLADGTIAMTRWRSTDEGASVVLVDARDAAAPVVVGDVLLPPRVGFDSDTDNDGVLSFVGTLVPTPDGGRLIAGGLEANVSDGDFRDGTSLTTQTTARGALGEISVAGAGMPGETSFFHVFDELDMVSSAVFAPQGDRLFVSLEGAEAIVAVDAFTYDSVGSLRDVGHAVEGLAIDPTGQFLFVHASLSRVVRVYDVSDLSHAPAVLAEIPTVATEPLAPDVLTGAILFHRSADPRMSRTSYLSCASCHLDGEADGLTWDFTQRGEGMRNTIPLRGRAGTAHGPMHWSANFDEVQDFEQDIRGGQGGTGFLPDALFHMGTRDTSLGDPKAGLSPELDALAAYLSSLTTFGTSPFRRDGDATWEAARDRGETIFRDPAVGCATCHAGARYTDSAFDASHVPLLHDVGTIDAAAGQRLHMPLTGFDTPTLRGLWSSGPYLHDGSAATLREVLVDRNPTDQHGTTSTLTPTQLDDLETFLLSLDDLAS